VLINKFLLINNKDMNVNLDNDIKSLTNVLSSMNNLRNKTDNDSSDYKMYLEILSIFEHISNKLKEYEKKLSLLSQNQEGREEISGLLETIFLKVKSKINQTISTINIGIKNIKRTEDDQITTDMERNPDEMELRIKNTVPEISKETTKIEDEALDNYISSLLIKKETKKYPWTYYVDNIIDMPLKDPASDEPNVVFLHNFMLMSRKIYFMTKLNIRNISILRLADLEEKDLPTDFRVDNIIQKFNSYKKILEQLLFIKVPSTFLLSNSVFRTLIGKKWSSFSRLLINSGVSKLIKTETLLKYILIACDQIKHQQLEQYGKFIDEVMKILIIVLQRNSEISNLSSIIGKSDTEFNANNLKSLHNSENRIFTFVKIRADKIGVNIEINPRFRVGTDISNQIMLLGYDPNPQSIFTPDSKNTGIPKLDSKFSDLNDKNHIFPNNYLFGPFSQIFNPDKSNSEIANDESMKPLLDNIRNGHSVCVIGYGSSGSGKTSSLVYAGFEETQERKNGILIHFCNKLKTDYNELEVSFVELEGNKDKTEEEAITDFKVFSEDKGEDERRQYYKRRTFIQDRDQWVLSEDSNLTSIGEIKFSPGIELGKYIVTIMEKRTIRATPNNPVSNRSHMLIFVRFKRETDKLKGETDKLKGETDKSPFLVVCDFVGVENKFACGDPSVLEMFEQIKSRTECDVMSNGVCTKFKPFYPVKQEVEKLLNSEEARYIERRIPELKISLVERNKILFEKVPFFTGGNDRILQLPPLQRDQKDKNKVVVPFVEILENFSKFLYDYGKKSSDVFGAFDKSIESLKKVCLTPHTTNKPFLYTDFNEGFEYIIKPVYDIKGVHSETRSDFNRSLGKYFKQIKNRFNLREISKTETGKKFPIFVQSMIDIGLRDEKNRESPLVDSINTYIKECLSTLTKLEGEINSINESTSKKTRILSEAKSKRKNMLTDICTSRVKEGLFINDSLLNLPRFISHFVTGTQGNKIMNPKFIDECAPLQCNPNFEDCFGNSNEQTTQYSVIASEIEKRLCSDSDKEGCELFKGLSFCVFNVINLSVFTNDPPPVPHIDISSLSLELNRLESLETKSNSYLSDSSDSPVVNSEYLEGINKSPLLDEKFVGSLTDPLKTTIKNIVGDIRMIPSNDKEAVTKSITNLRKLINTINSNNSLSTVGTMEFTDMISKFGLNRTTCNYKYRDDVALHGKLQLEIQKNISEYKNFISNLYTRYGKSIMRG
jgi:hypothetical protein